MQNVTAVVAIKPWARAKSRLAAIRAEQHPRLVQAMMLDTCRAVTAAGCSLVVVSDQLGLGDLLGQHGLGARVLPDPGGGMNAALAAGAASTPTPSAPGAATVLAVVSDLPCLDAASLEDVLEETGSAAGRWFVPDRSGVGTTMLLARGNPLAPAFEGPSAQQHRDSGAHQVPASLSARLDVDDEVSLVEAMAHGVGAETADWAGRQPWLRPVPESSSGAIHRFLTRSPDDPGGPLQ